MAICRSSQSNELRPNPPSIPKQRAYPGAVHSRHAQSHASEPDTSSQQEHGSVRRRGGRGGIRLTGGGGWHKASVFGCLPLAVPIGLSPLLILTLCRAERVVVVSTEPLDDLRGGVPPPPPHCTDSTPKTFPYPNTSPNRISYRQKLPPPTAFASPVTALQPLHDCSDGPPPLQAKPLGGQGGQAEGWGRSTSTDGRAQLVGLEV